MILVPAIYASGLTIASVIYTQGAKRIWFYAGLFLTIFSITYFIENTPLLADETVNVKSAFYEFWQPEKKTSPFAIEIADMAKVNYHKRKAAEAFCEAEDLCLFLPNDKRDIAYQLFESCVEATAATWMGGWPGLISDLVVQLTRYGVFCCKQADKIKDLLKESEYHYHMATYYYNKQL